MSPKQNLARMLKEIDIAYPSLKVAALAWKVKTWSEFYVQGFILKNTQWTWTGQQMNKLKVAIVEMSQNPASIPVKDWSYYIAHYKFDGLVPVKEVRRRLIQLLKELYIK